jgi:putative PIN family toxin of toxin-antitoxin system
MPTRSRLKRPARPPLVVIDTLVVVSAIIGTQESASFALMRAVETGEVQLAVSDDWLRELVRVLEYPRIAERIGVGTHRPARAFRIALGIGLMGSLFRPRRLDWPSLIDPNDGWIFDLALESNAAFVVSRDRRVIEAGTILGFEVLEPGAALHRMRG